MLYNERTAAKQKSCEKGKKSFGMELTGQTDDGKIYHVSRTDRHTTTNRPMWAEGKLKDERERNHENHFQNRTEAPCRECRNSLPQRLH